MLYYNVPNNGPELLDHPLENCYISQLSLSSIAIADLCDYGGLVGGAEGLILTRINVPREYRGKGEGTDLLKRILADADRDKVTLYLEISPSDGLNWEQLEAWYLRHGFKKWHGIYRRLPVHV